MTSGAGATLGYDVANRLKQVTPVSGGNEYYGYAPDNKRVFWVKPDGSEEWTLFGARGEKLGTYTITGPEAEYNNQGSWTGQRAWFNPVKISVWFSGRLVSEGMTAVYQDRLGTNRAGGARFLPYGEELGTATAQDRVKFGTYTRDSFTGLDYADQRFYASSYGRFNTADPSEANVEYPNPISLNRYAYVNGDPANFNDPTGLGFWARVWSTITGGGGGGGAETSGTQVPQAGGESLKSVAAADEGDGDSCAGACGGSGGGTPTFTANACAGTGQVWTGSRCDVPIYGFGGQGGAIGQQIGQNVQNFNGFMGAFAGGSILGGVGVAAAITGPAGVVGLSGAMSQPIPVIGSLAQTLPLSTNAMYNVLPQAGWTLAGNQAWVNEIIASGQSVSLVTNLAAASTFNGGIYNGGFTMFGVELGWFFQAGYEVVGSYLVKVP